MADSQVQAKSEPTESAIPPLTWVLSISRGVRAELRIVGKEVTKGDLQRLKQQIDFLVELFEDEPEKSLQDSTLLREIQDALVCAFYCPDPVDPDPLLDYSRVDWLGVIEDARQTIEGLK